MTALVGQDLTDSGIALHPDLTRVITRFFVPGREDVGPGGSRAAPVIERIMQLDERDVHAAMHDVDARFTARHHELHRTFGEHAELVMSRIEPGSSLSRERLLLLGACFTHEYAIEGAALCNPSAVLHPDEDGASVGTSTGASFVISVRGIGEGHRSSIGFRTGRIAADGSVTVDPAGPFPRTATARPGRHRRSVFQTKLAELGDDPENVTYVLDPLPLAFDDDDLAGRIDRLAGDMATRRRTDATIGHLRRLATSSYRIDFGQVDDLSERVLFPHAPAEAHGMEDARFVRFVDDSGDVTYHGTYTAFDGRDVAVHLLTTVDFTTFDVSPLAGAAAAGKGLALFPRRIGGRYAALSRSDRETNAVAFTDDLYCWPTSEPIQVPTRPWEILQLGNCGSPIETEEGWLVLTHGVGAMRTYSLGAILLDLDDPRQVVRSSPEPILAPTDGRRDGYVPNVVYSCGGFAHGDTLVLPYGIADQTISVATLSIRTLLASMRPAVAI